MQKAINDQPPHHGFPSPPTAAGRSYSVPIYALPSGKHRQQSQDDDDVNDKEQQRGRPPLPPCPLPGFCRDWHEPGSIANRAGTSVANMVRSVAKPKKRPCPEPVGGLGYAS
ncbi:hypothetical protein niasHT_009009 [Heterodera trifolii]|uniref:Uncharacterized protein n=1 Tax=Heterodera trifolii TaxID=157864 RepID=A0ABD2LW90_9BILA